MRNLDLAALALATVVACTPTPQEDEERVDSQQLTQALDIIQRTKLQLIQQIGGGDEGLNPKQSSNGTLMSAIHCAVSPSLVTAKHEAYDIALSEVQDWFSQISPQPPRISAMTAEASSPSGTVACAQVWGAESSSSSSSSSRREGLPLFGRGSVR